ncbi:MAG: RNA 2',3'-cyclic phosphodiesterase [Desulfobacterales bacterium]
MNAPPKIRTFIAIDLPDHVRTMLARIQEQLKTEVSGITWTPPQNIHLTLKFPGYVLQEDLAGLEKAVSAAASCVRPFELCTAKIGAFPGLNRPRVIWVGVAGNTVDLNTLYQGVEDRMASAGFEKEDKKFAGHLTIGRVKGKAKIDPVQMVEGIGRIKMPVPEHFFVDRIVVYRSDLRSTGAVYTELFHKALA